VHEVGAAGGIERFEAAGRVVAGRRGMAKSSSELTATVGAGPSSMRGVCAVMATARNGDAGAAHRASHVPLSAR
jgi:hypothetical protein